jgi:anti-sigma factor RsiW
MKCAKVTARLAGYLDDAVVGAPDPKERREIGLHLDSCGDCREELQRYRKLAVLLSRMPRAVPPADLALRIKIAAAKEQENRDWASAGSA